MSNLEKSKKLFLCMITLVMVFCIVFMMVQNTFAYAEEKVSFEDSKVLDDLLSSTINGKAFDITDYPFNQNKDIQLLSFVEFGYSVRPAYKENYGLYVYIYNPKAISIEEKSSSNKIQIATAFDKDGKATNYEKFNLKFCNKVDNGDYKNLFYKFRVLDRDIKGTHFFDRVNSLKRVYQISGLELTTKGKDNATEYNVSSIYKYSGFAQGLGSDMNSASTLDCKVESIESIALSVKHTFYRSKTSALGDGHQNQLDSVYFSVPKRFIEEYGKLQRIKAEWYEYKTKEIVVTSNSNFYNKASQYIGQEIATTPNSTGQYPYNKDIGYGLGVNAGKVGDIYIAKWGWNLGEDYMHIPCNALYYMFKVNNIEEYDPYASIVDIGGVQSNDLYEWIKNYNKSSNNGYLPIKNGNISADLFMEDIDDSRKLDNESGKIQQGYSYYDFDADVDLQTLSSWNETSPSFWDNWINFGLGEAFKGGPNEETRVVPPIQILNNSDFQGNNEDIADRLLVNYNDVEQIKQEHSKAQSNDEVLVLFRFATSDYVSMAADIIEKDEGFLWSDKHTSGQAYVAQESVFFDFDIIQLTFNKDGLYTVIPTVSDPTDIIDDITPPVHIPEPLEWWKILLAIVLLILFLLVFGPIIPYIIKFVVWLIVFPFKLIADMCKSINRKIKKKKEEKGE